MVFSSATLHFLQFTSPHAVKHQRLSHQQHTNIKRCHDNLNVNIVHQSDGYSILDEVRTDTGHGGGLVTIVVVALAHVALVLAVCVARFTM